MEWEPKSRLHSGRGQDPRQSGRGRDRQTQARSLTFGGGARACDGRSASFSRSAAFRTCSSGTCRLTRSRKSRLERGTFNPEAAGGVEVSGASHPDSRARPAICLPPSPSATLSSRPQRVWNDFLSCSSTAFAASNWPLAAARAACSSRLRARLLCCAGAPRSCDAAGFSFGAAAAGGGSDLTGEGGARRKRTWEQSEVVRRWARAGGWLAARPPPSSPAVPCGPRPVGPPAPSAVQGCSRAAGAQGSRTAGSGSGSDPGRAPALGLRAPGREVLEVALGPPGPLPLPPTPALTPYSPSSWRGSLGAKGHEARPHHLLSPALPENRWPLPQAGGGETPSPALWGLLSVTSPALPT